MFTISVVWRRYRALLDSASLFKECSNEPEISSKVSQHNVLLLFIYTAPSHISEIPQPRRGQDLLWSGNVSISSGSQDQALYGTLKERVILIPGDTMCRCFFCPQEIALAIYFLSCPG